MSEETLDTSYVCEIQEITGLVHSPNSSNGIWCFLFIVVLQETWQLNYAVICTEWIPVWLCINNWRKRENAQQNTQKGLFLSSKVKTSHNSNTWSRPPKLVHKGKTQWRMSTSQSLYIYICVCVRSCKVSDQSGRYYCDLFQLQIHCQCQCYLCKILKLI